MKAIPVILLTLGLSACSIFQSPERRAQTHLRKAVSLDPTIIQSSTKDSVSIKDSVVFTDSVRIKDSIDIRVKDSVIIRPPSEIEGDIEAICDSLGKLRPFDFKLGAGVNKIHVWSTDGTHIRFTSKVPELVSTIHSKDTYISQLRDSIATREALHLEEKSQLEKKVVTIVRNKPTTWQVIKLVGLGLLVGLIGGILVGKFTKFKLPFQASL